MERVTVKNDNWTDEIVAKMVAVLRNGGIVMHPTETCYGLAVDVFNEDAVRDLYRLKKMPTQKPVSIIVESIADAGRWGEIDDNTMPLIERYWPGPFTFLVPRKSLLPPYFNRGAEKVALRCPSYESLIKVVKKIGHPITTTSANLSGSPTVYEVDEFFRQMRGERLLIEPDLVIDGGKLEANPPSAIYDAQEEMVIRGEMKI